MNASDIALTGLLEHEGFIRRVVGGVLRDEARVQDVVQETWIRALARRSKDDLPGRAWLARTARNLAISNWRSEDRRKRRELEGSPSRVAEASSASLLRVEQGQLISQAILALSEPHRTVILLRYEEGRNVAEIARRMGTSPGTVRSQLSRAHGMLRERLDESFVERDRWAVLAAPLSGPSSLLPAVGWLAAGCFVALGAIVWSVRQGADRIPAVLAESEVSSVDANPGPLTLQAAQGPLSVRQEPPIERGRVGEGATSASTPSGEHQLVLPPFQLLDRAHFEDYQLATFSFLKGLRDDPGMKITRNDWDIQLSHNELDVNMVVDDSSSILALGRLDPTTLDESFELGQRPKQERVKVSAGQTYLVLTQDRDSDIATLLHVKSHEPGRSATFDWITTDGTARCKGSIVDGATLRPLTSLLDRLREEARRADWLEEPDVHLQMRACLGGGNPHEAQMSPLQSGYIDAFLGTPLNLMAPLEVGERSSGYSSGGWIPSDKKFVVTHATYWGRPYPERDAEFVVDVGGIEIFRAEGSESEVRGEWTGRIEVLPGMERGTRLETSYFEVAETRLHGTFEPWTRPEGHGYGALNAGFFEIHEADPPPIVHPLAAPEAHFQLRAGAGGGNPNRIDLVGRTSLYVDHVRDGLLDLHTPIEINDPSEAYVLGGRIPEGERFIVTRVGYAGSTKGDSNGSGYLKIRVGGKLLCDREKESEPFEDAWDGEITLLSGEESRTYVEVGNSSWADVWIEGRFEEIK